jgi:hypothetical protein
MPLDLRAGVFTVCRYHRGREGADRFEYLPNVKAESIHFREGAVLPTAQFSYVMDDTDPSTPTPYRFEQLWPMDAAGPYVVRPEDELLVYHLQEGADGPLLIFDGFAQIPQVDMSGGGLSATFTAVGAHVRLWDRPVANARYRDAYDAEDGPDVVTGLPVHFNPEDAPGGNCTPEGHDRNEGEDDARPVFVDAQATGRRPWTLPGAIRYLFWEANPDEEFVKNPVAYTGQELDDYLESVIPEGTNGSFFDLSDPDTYSTEPIVVRSVDATGRMVVEVAEELLGAYGFKLFMNTRPDYPDDPMAPVNELILFRVDGRDAVAPKQIWMPPHGSAWPVPPPQAGSIRLARDKLSSFNAVYVQTGLEEVELSVVLAPDFEVDAADALDVGRFAAGVLANASAEVRRKYRAWTADEDGAGHWDLDAADWVVGEPLDLSSVFQGENPSGSGPAYVARRRPGTATLFSKDGAGRPRRAELAISRDYAGASPAIWDRSGTWRSLGESGWRLMKDRLGVEITAENPESWSLPNAPGDSQVRGDAVAIVSSLTNATTEGNRFWLRLTVVIRGDFDAGAFAEKRESAPSRFATRRLIDAREHYRLQKVHRSSAFNAAARDEVARDDAPRATAHAAAMRLAHEGTSVAGTIAIPYVTHAIGVGDLIEGLAGRDLSFAEMGGEDAGEGPQYPAVVGFSWTCQLPQTTTLFLSDRRAEGAAADRGDGRYGSI